MFIAGSVGSGVLQPQTPEKDDWNTYADVPPSLTFSPSSPGSLLPTPPLGLSQSHTSASNFLSGAERWALRKLGDDAWLLGVPPHLPGQGMTGSRSEMVLYEFQR